MNQHLGKHLWRFLPGGVTAAAIAFLLWLGSFQSLEQIAYRHLFQARGSMPWDDRVVLVAIDDASLKKLGRFPWSRRYYTQLLNILSADESSIVAMDLIWSEPSSEDAQLAEAMTQQGRVVLAQAWDKTGAPLLPVSALAAAAIATGHTLKREDSDGVVRQVDLQIHGELALGVAAVQAYSMVQTSVALPNLDAPYWVNWISPASQLPSYSFADVIQGKVSAQSFRNKIVLVGVTAAGLDPLVTPFDRNPPTGSVYLHATVIHNLLHQSSLHPLQRRGLWLLLLLSAPSLSWLMSTWSTRQQLVVITGLCCGWSLLGLLLFHANDWLPIASPLTLFVTTAVTFALSDRLREDYLLRRQLAHLWKHYRQDLIIHAVEASHPLIPMQKQTLPEPNNAVSRVAQLAALADLLGRSQATQMTIAHTLSIGLLAADRDGTVWFCNPVAAKALQLAVGNDLKGKLVPNWLSSRQWQTGLDCLKTGNSIKHSHLQRGDRWFHILLQPLTYRTLTTTTNRAKPLDGLLLLLEDITDHKQAETELQQAKETAMCEAARSEEANRAKSEFLTNMSHELRTPLNVILGFTQVMNHDKALNLDQQKHLEIINRSGQHLLGLINDVLEMSKIEAGRVRLNTTSFDLYHLLDQLESMLRVRANAKQVALSFEHIPALPQYITTDEGKLRQVLLNLIGNAIKFTDVGTVMLRVSVEDGSVQGGSVDGNVDGNVDGDASRSIESRSIESRSIESRSIESRSIESRSVDGNVDGSVEYGCVGVPENRDAQQKPPHPIILTFEIEDTGSGIASEELKDLFQPFAQARAGQQAKEGTGLGLAISRTFIHLMGGDITVRSTIAQGSVFTFQIRAMSVAADNIAAPLKVDRILALAPNQLSYRILIVEDRWENSQFLVKLLAPLGFQVREASDGQEGVAVWVQWQPHLILMDMRMPVMNGSEATRKIRSLEQGQERKDHSDIAVQNRENALIAAPSTASPSLTKIIALTASVFEDAETTAVAIGCDDFLRKPIQENMLLAKLAEHLGVRYLYENADQQECLRHDHSTATTMPALRVHLVQMPPEWTEKLHQAAIRGADWLILQLIEQIPEAHAPLTCALTDWVENFQFDEIIYLVQPPLP